MLPETVACVKYATAMGVCKSAALEHWAAIEASGFDELSVEENVEKMFYTALENTKNAFSAVFTDEFRSALDTLHSDDLSLHPYDAVSRLIHGSQSPKRNCIDKHV